MLMSPERVSDAWVQWVADPFIMLPLGVKPRRTDKQQLSRYVMQMHARQRAVIGIFGGEPEQHIGLIEVSFERRHLVATIEVLIDIRRHDYAAVAREVLPRVLGHLANRFKIEKFVAMVPETHAGALAYFGGGDWSLEAELAEEAPSDALARRLNMHQFAWFPQPAA